MKVKVKQNYGSRLERSKVLASLVLGEEKESLVHTDAPPVN